MDRPLRVLIIDDSEDDALLLVRELKRGGYAPTYERADTAVAMHTALAGQSWDIILSDFSMPAFSALDALKLLHDVGLDLPFIIVSGTINEVMAVDALKAGAHDFVVKGNFPRLVPAIERELREAQNRAGRRLAEERLTTTMDAMAEGAQIIGFDWRYLYVNNAVAAQGHKTKDELLGHTMAEVYPGIEQTELFAELRLCMEQRAARRMANEFVYPDGSKGWFELNIEPVPEGLFILSQDITERRQAEVALRESEQRYRTLIERMSEAVLIVDDDRRFVDANPAASGLLGMPRQGILTCRADDVTAADLRAAIEPTWLAFLAQSELRGEWRLTRPDGSLRDVEYSAAANFMPGRHVSVVRDITERKLAEAQIRDQLARLAALREIDQAIIGSLDLKVTLNVFLSQVVTQLNVDAADVLLLEPRRQVLEYAAGRGFRSPDFQQVRQRAGEGRAGQVVLERRIVASDISDLRPASKRTGLLGGDAFESYYGVPLIAKGQVLGVLEIFHRSLLRPAPEWLEFLEALAGQAAIAIDNARLFDSLQNTNQELVTAYDATIAGWSRALDLRDHETEGHSQRVTELTARLALALSLNAQDLVHVRRGALLHDIGKMGIPDNILLKPGPLTEDEWVIMRQHPALAYELLSPIQYLRPALEIPYCHHEKWNGTGYPRGLRGDLIPLPARLFAVVDVWDALRSDRPYRRAWPAAKVRGYVRDQAGKHFDPAVAEAFLKMPLGD